MPMLARYVEEVTPTKKGESQERYRAAQLKKTKLAAMHLDKITGEVVAQYRDQRLTEVSNNTVRLELAFLSVVFEQCRKEWGFAVSNPVKQIRMPKPGKPRQRRLEAGEEDALLAACKASGAHYLHSFVVLAIETGMRFSELAGVVRANVNFEKRTIYLPDTKNGEPRTVPLSTRALNAIHALPSSINGRLFGVKSGSIRSAYLIAVQNAQATRPDSVTFLQGLTDYTSPSLTWMVLISRTSSEWGRLSIFGSHLVSPIWKSLHQARGYVFLCFQRHPFQTLLVRDLQVVRTNYSALARPDG